ncbi:MAG: hypothetical protein MSH44_04620 [Christensenellaceae bacterium]|nr:hypothetical protein [Christensenellaceae bacterium]
MTTFAKLTDNLTVRACFFLLTLLWLQFFIRKLWVSIIAAFAITLAFFIAAKALSKKLPREKSFSKNDLVNALVLKNAEDIKSLYLLAVPSDKNFIKCAFRFSAATPDDVAAAFRESGDRDVTLIVNECGRQVMVYASSLPKKINIVNKNKLYKTLKTAGLLPKPVEMTKPEKKYVPPKETLSYIFSKRNVKYFLFSGIILTLMAFVTPLKLYYLIVASLSLLFALVSEIIYLKS